MTNIRRWSSTPSFRPRTRPSSAMAGSIIRAWSERCSTIRRKSVSGGRAKGGSTITQQVAKYLLQDDEYAISRKIREMILAFRLEDTLSKQQILELYLNSIFLGRNAYGVQAASRAYFDKDVADLTLPEAAYLAVLPKAPSNYDPVRATERALARRNYVLREMANNGYITEAQRAAAAATALGTIRYGSSAKFRDQGGYFMEEVRRDLMKRFGEDGRRRAQQRLCRRPVGPHLDGAQDAGRGGRGAARGAGQVRRRARLARHRPQHRRQRRLADAIAGRRARHRLPRLEEGGRAGQIRRQRADRLPRRIDRVASGVGRCPAGARRRRNGVQRAPPGHDHRRQAARPRAAMRCARSPKSAAVSSPRKSTPAG